MGGGFFADIESIASCVDVFQYMHIRRASFQRVHALVYCLDACLSKTVKVRNDDEVSVVAGRWCYSVAAWAALRRACARRSEVVAAGVLVSKLIADEGRHALSLLDGPV